MLSTPLYKVVSSSRFGRNHLVATADIPARHVIIREDPTAMGINFQQDIRFCFACSSQIRKKQKKLVCCKCEIAELCRAECQVNLKYHTSHECDMFKVNKELLANVPVSRILLILRLLLVKSRNPVLWKKIMNLTSRMVERAQQEDLWEMVENVVVNPIKKLRIPGHPKLNAGLIHLLCGIAQVNAFSREFRQVDIAYVQGVYVEATMMAHSCRPNTYMTFNKNFHLTIYATQVIKKDEPLFLNRARNYVADTIHRRSYLLKTKYFQCDCPLCSDPCEMGSHLGSLKCPRCVTGIVVRLKDTFSFAKNSIWKCQDCHHKCSGYLIKTLYKLVERLTANANENTNREKLEKAYNSLTLSLHPNHCVLCTTKVRLIHACIKGITHNTSMKHLKRIIEMCDEMRDLMDIIQPGLSYEKGTTLYFKTFAKKEMLYQQLKNKEIDQDDYAKGIEEIINILEDSARNVLLQPSQTMGHIAARSVLKALQEHRYNLKTLRGEKQK